MAAGYLNVSYNAGATWSGIDWIRIKRNFNRYSLAGQCHIRTAGRIVSAAAACIFNPLVPNELIASAGTGVWTTPTSTLPTGLNDTLLFGMTRALGIEQLVANEIIVPPGGDPVLASWDRLLLYQESQRLSIDLWPSC